MLTSNSFIASVPCYILSFVFHYFFSFFGSSGHWALWLWPLLGYYSRLLLSELQWTLWKTTRYPYFDISDLRKWGKQLIEQPLLTEWICNLTPKLYIENIVEKRRNPMEQFHLFSTIFCCLLVDLCVRTGTRFSLRDKRLFEISEFEITRVDCIIIGL